MLWRVPAFSIYVLLHLNLTTCRSSSGGESPTAPATPEEQATAQPDSVAQGAAAVGPLAGVDTSALTSAEQRKFEGHVSQLLAPCPDQPVSLAQCIKEQRSCSLCVPAANFLVNRVRRGDPQDLVESAFRGRFAPEQVKPIELGDSPWKGSESGSVVIVEWADFECPFCRLATPVIDDLVKRFHRDVKLVFKNYPLPAHTHAELAARATLAARKQGKFWKMHAALFAPGQALEKADILKVAAKLELDLAQFQADMDSEQTQQTIARDKEQAQKLGLRGTPLLYINGRHFDLEQFDLGEDLVPWVELEIATREAAPTKAPAGAAPAGE